jgi:hypothetical protein
MSVVHDPGDVDSLGIDIRRRCKTGGLRYRQFVREYLPVAVASLSPLRSPFMSGLCGATLPAARGWTQELIGRSRG